MKIIHCADLHLDSKMTANLTKEKAKERKLELLRTFKHLVGYAASNDVDCIIIAGDLFDTRNVSVTARNEVRDAILGNPGIDFLYLRGNHDGDNFLSKLDEIPANLKLFEESWTKYSYGNVEISGFEFGVDNQNTYYNSLVLDADKYNIVVMHGQICDYYNNQIEDCVGLNELKNKNIDYLALGHIHSYMSGQIDARGIYCYPGCLEGRGFDECGEKGFILLEIDDSTKAVNTQFLKIPSRTLYTVEVDMTGVMTTDEAAKKIEAAFNEAAFASNSLVKVLLTGFIDVESDINADYLRELFQSYFYFVKVTDDTKYQINYSDYEKDESLKGEFIRLILSLDMDEDKKSKIIKTGISALLGEEI